MKSFARGFVFATLVLLALSGARRRAVAPVPPPKLPELKLERSFAVTDKAILDGFRFRRVLETLVARSSAPNMSAEKLFRQWWDTQNAKPGLDASMPHCDDFLTGGQPSHNGFLRRCPTNEGKWATAAFEPDDFIPLGITNRFDLAGGAQCGQYRVVYAKKSLTPLETFHIIFEGALANPNPALGVAACRPVAQFWAELSAVETLSERRARLERFFFTGIDGFAPVFDPDHFHAAPAGIRTLQFTQPAPTTRFYQFRLIDECTGAGCRLYMKPDVLENLPNGKLFDSRIDDERGRRFREVFLQNVKALAAPNLHAYTMNIPAEFLIAESDPNEAGVFDFPFIFDGPFIAAKATAEGKAFHDAIEAETRKAGSALTPTQIINRAETQNCVGCHFLTIDVGDGIRFPRSHELQHITEDEVEDGEGGKGSRFAISPAVRVFVGHRMTVLRDYLEKGTAPVAGK